MMLSCTLIMLIHFVRNTMMGSPSRISTRECAKGVEHDEKVMIRNGYNRIPRLAQVTKWERNTNNKDGIKYQRAQAKSQEDSCSPEHDHQSFLNKVNKKSTTNRKRDSMNNRSLMTASNKLPSFKLVFRARNPRSRFL